MVVCKNRDGEQRKWQKKELVYSALQFTEFAQFCHKNGIHHVLVTPYNYHPLSNGLTERSSADYKEWYTEDG